MKETQKMVGRKEEEEVENMGEVEEMVEFVDKTLRDEGIEVEERYKLERLAKAICDIEDENDRLETLDIGELTERICSLNWGYQKTSIEETEISDELRKEISDETKYLPIFGYNGEDLSGIESKAELKELLIGIVKDEIITLDDEYDESDVYEALADIFGSETLAEVSTANEDTHTTISVKRIVDLNRYYLTIDDNYQIKAIEL